MPRHKGCKKNNNNTLFFPQEYFEVFKYLVPTQQHTATFLINTGARINEARNVKLEDVDINNKRMTIKVTKARAVIGESIGKPRTIPISSKFAAYLAKYTRESKLSQKDTFKLLSTNGFNAGLKKACMKAGLKDWKDFSANNLRKTFEVWIMSLGVDNQTMLNIMGYSFSTAIHYYISPDCFTIQERQMIRDILGDIYMRGLS